MLPNGRNTSAFDTADAYIKPIVSAQLRQRFANEGVTQHAVVIKSNGGDMTLEAAADRPIEMTVSGPTGGVVAGKHIARLLGVGSLVTLDMGGTSTDVSTIVDGKENFTTNFEIDWGVPIQIPMIDIRSIGAGGGSIAWIDKGGMLRVGPQSAGAKPGPACFGAGGVEATVTDANLVMGRISADNFLGGSMRLNVDAAEAAVGRIATQLDMTPDAAAMAIAQIANNNMVGALRSVLIERGLDPRDFTLMGFGGAGPLHTCDLMLDTGIPHGIIPNHPGQFSAYGFILADARVDRHRTMKLTSKRFDPARATQVMSELVAAGVSDLQDQGYVDNIEAFRSSANIFTSMSGNLFWNRGRRLFRETPSAGLPKPRTRLSFRQHALGESDRRCLTPRQSPRPLPYARRHDVECWLSTAFLSRAPDMVTSACSWASQISQHDTCQSPLVRVRTRPL